MMFAGHGLYGMHEHVAEEPRVTVGEFHCAVFVELLNAAGVRAVLGLLATAEPALQVAHAVVHHLRMNLQQVEVEEGRVVLATAHLRFHAVAAARPIEMVRAFAEERPAVRVALELEQLGVELHLGPCHRGHRRGGGVVELVPRRHARMHVEIRGGGAVAKVGVGGILLGETEGAVALEAEALDLRAGVVPRERWRAVGLEHARGGIVARRVGIKVDVVLVERPDVTALVGGLAEYLHPFVAAHVRVRGQVIGQLHVVAVALPVVLNDDDVVHAVVLEFAELRGVALVGAFVVAPDVEHHARAERGEERRRRVREVRQHFAHVRRDGDVARLEERIACAVGLQVIRGRAARTLGGIGNSPVEDAADEDILRGQVLDLAIEIRDGKRLAERSHAYIAEGEVAHHRLVATCRNDERLAHDPEFPRQAQGLAAQIVFPKHV